MGKESILSHYLGIGTIAMNISIVIPVFNDARALHELIERVFAVMDMAGWNAEVVVVDDGSENEVWSEMERIRSFFPERRIRLLKLLENSGQNRATLFGIKHCTHDFIVTMDSDLQHPPEEIPLLIQALSGGHFELVYGSAFEGHSFARRVAGYVFFKVSRLSRLKAVRGSAFRAMTRGAANRLMSEADPSFLLIDAVLRKMEVSMTRVETQHHRRKYGESSYSIYSLLLMALRGFWFYMLPPKKIRKEVFIKKNNPKD